MTSPFRLAGTPPPAAALPGLRLPAALPPPGVVPADAPGLFVAQREYAVVPRAAGRVVGSDAATTCVVLIVADPGRVFGTHLDGCPGQGDALEAVLADTFAGSPAVDVHLAGGFADGAELSAGVADLAVGALAGFARRAGAVLDVRTCRLVGANTTAGVVRWRGRPATEPAPAVRALALDTRTGEVLVNRWFADRGPDAVARQAAGWLGRSPLRRLGDPPALGPPPAGLAELLGLADEDLLEQTSTSPRVEHPGYADEMREQVQWLLVRT